jgi:hypothetical protein
MIGFLTDFLVSIIPTFIVSRLFLWATQWSNSVPRLVVVHVASLCVCVLVGTAVLAISDTHKLLSALALFAPGQLAWLLVDAFRLIRRRRKTGD